MIVIGLTGSIGMGKTTTSEMFKAAGVPVISSDEIVHALYRGEAAPLVEQAFPGTTNAGVVDREALSRQLMADPSGFSKLEAIIHPLVRARQKDFIDQSARNGAEIAVLDIPLLFETGAETRVDAVVVVSCDAALQQARVLDRPGMTEEKFEAILARQTPDAEKRARADFIVDTGRGLDDARAQVAAIIEALGKTANRSESGDA